MKGGRGAFLPIAVLALTLAPPVAPAMARQSNLSLSMADLVARLLPTVVSVASSRAVPSAALRGEMATTEDERRTSGSGFVVDPSGLIMTNKHVVADAVHLTVTLQDGMTFAATLVGEATVSDIALLKIVPMRRLQAVTFGDSSKLRQGDPVLAIGNPLGLGGSVSSGIVSGLGRDIGELSPFGDFIQTDAAINHGNSGGPLFDGSGRVVGMDTALYSPNPTGGSVGLGFAIPSSDLIVVGGMLRKYGRVHAGWLGLRVQRLTPGLAEAARYVPPDKGLSAGGMPAEGVIVVSVDPDGPAARGGIEPGDIVVSGAGVRPSDPRSLEFAIAKQTIGSVCPIVVWRNGAELTLTPTVLEWPSARGIGATRKATVEMRMDLPDFGLKLAPAGSGQQLQYNLTPATGGVLVQDIDPASAAATTELTPGDVVREVQHTVVRTPEEVIKTLTQVRDSGQHYGMLLIDGPGGLRWMALALRN